MCIRIFLNSARVCSSLTSWLSSWNSNPVFSLRVPNTVFHGLVWTGGSWGLAAIGRFFVWRGQEFAVEVEQFVEQEVLRVLVDFWGGTGGSDGAGSCFPCELWLSGPWYAISSNDKSSSDPEPVHFLLSVFLSVFHNKLIICLLLFKIFNKCRKKFWKNTKYLWNQFLKSNIWNGDFK